MHLKQALLRKAAALPVEGAEETKRRITVPGGQPEASKPKKAEPQRNIPNRQDRDKFYETRKSYDDMMKQFAEQLKAAKDPEQQAHLRKMMEYAGKEREVFMRSGYGPVYTQEEKRRAFKPEHEQDIVDPRFAAQKAQKELDQDPIDQIGVPARINEARTATLPTHFSPDVEMARRFLLSKNLVSLHRPTDPAALRFQQDLANAKSRMEQYDINMKNKDVASKNVANVSHYRLNFEPGSPEDKASRSVIEQYDALVKSGLPPHKAYYKVYDSVWLGKGKEDPMQGPKRTTLLWLKNALRGGLMADAAQQPGHLKTALLRKVAQDPARVKFEAAAGKAGYPTSPKPGQSPADWRKAMPIGVNVDYRLMKTKKMLDAYKAQATARLQQEKAGTHLGGTFAGEGLYNKAKQGAENVKRLLRR